MSLAANAEEMERICSNIRSRKASQVTYSQKPSRVKPRDVFKT